MNEKKKVSHCYVMKTYLAFHSTSFPKQNTISLSYRICRLILLMIIKAEKRNSKNFTHLEWVKIPAFSAGHTNRILQLIIFA